MRKRLVALALVLLLTIGFIPEVLGQFREDIINFDGVSARVVEVAGRWKVAAGNMWLLDFGANQSQANQALQVIRFYHLNQQCFVGRPGPSMQYYLNNGGAPLGPMPNEDCIFFDNNNLRVAKINNRWKIVEGGNHLLLDFDQNEAEAWTALRIIWKYDFSYICFVGRPNPPLTYFRR